VETDQTLKAKIRADLPAQAFVNRPRRALFVFPLVGLIGLGSITLVLIPLPWYLAVFGSLLLGSLYGSLMFLGHEIAHGATVRSPRLQNWLLYPAFAIYCLSPHLWRVWHQQVHHPYANMEGRDPDNFGTSEDFKLGRRSRAERLWLKFAPGSGHWLSATYLFLFFTFQIHGVLWLKSKGQPDFGQLRRGRAALDSAALAAFWLLVCLWAGPRGAVLVVLLPMLIANFVAMSYIMTNHLLRPLAHTRDTLGTTMSVTTPRLVDRVHFYFSHHVEHHLFPGMCSHYYPLVRQSLLRHAGDRYLAPPHWLALRVLFHTPRLYDGPQALVELDSGRRVEMATVEAWLRGIRT
jgi:fatty acid desaturase